MTARLVQSYSFVYALLSEILVDFGWTRLFVIILFLKVKKSFFKVKYVLFCIFAF